MILSRASEAFDALLSLKNSRAVCFDISKGKVVYFGDCQRLYHQMKYGVSLSSVLELTPVPQICGLLWLSHCSSWRVRERLQVSQTVAIVSFQVSSRYRTL